MLRETYISLLDQIGSWMFVNTSDLELINSIYVFFGVHDVLLLTSGILLYRSIKKTDKRKLRIGGIILFITLFLFIFPHFSAVFETQRRLFFEKVNGELIEGINLLYVWIRFPMYWLFGISIIITDNFKNKKTRYNTGLADKHK